MNAYYSLYIKSILKLSATLLIKSEYTSRTINDRLTLLGVYVDIDAPNTWKYYLNLAGEYHVTDTPMTIVSLDTLETIDFTKANLLIHRATRKEYAYGSRYYNELVTAYPSQQGLINGILNPIDIDTAVSANDHTILFYDKGLVEGGEQQLIPGLQRYIDLFFNRWNNQDYALVDPYYYSGLLGVLFTKLPLAIINLRKRACKTDHAHSYHIRQYLLSYSPVGREFDFMSVKLRLWLYRNIRYLNLNLGRQEIFDKVMQKVMTDRGFSMVAFQLTQRYENMPEVMKPEVMMVRKTLNGIKAAMGGDMETVEDILDREIPLNRDNVDYRDEELVSVTSKMQHSLYGALKTKVLESNVVDRTDSEAYTLSETLLNHWAYLSHFNLYTTSIAFTNPGNGDAYRLSAANAFIFFLYAYNRGNGITLSTVPVVSANRVLRQPLPTRTELRKLASVSLIPEYYLDYITDNLPLLDKHISVDAFVETCRSIQKVMLNFREMRSYAQDYKVEGALHTIIDRCYHDIRLDLAGEMEYDLWLKQMEIDTTTMGMLEYNQIAVELLTNATGQDLAVTSNMKAIHAAMLRIMQSLSSYSVQYIAEINDSPLRIVDGKFPKLTLPEFLGGNYIPAEVPNPTILDVDTEERIVTLLNTGAFTVGHRMVEEAIRQKIGVSVDITLVGSGVVGKAIENPIPIVTKRLPAIVDLSTITQDPLVIHGYDPIPNQSIVDLVDSGVLEGYELLTEARRKLLLQL